MDQTSFLFNKIHILMKPELNYIKCINLLKNHELMDTAAKKLRATGCTKYISKADPF